MIYYNIVNMRKNRALLKTQRKSLDEKLKNFKSARQVVPPKSGWVQAIREAIGMTTAQLAARMGIKQSGVTLLEKREVAKTVTLATLEKAARAMNCELVYALVPKESLEAIVDEQATIAAKRLLKRVTHSMNLEKQDAGEAETRLLHEDLALEIKNKMDKRLWDENE